MRLCRSGCSPPPLKPPALPSQPSSLATNHQPSFGLVPHLLVDCADTGVLIIAELCILRVPQCGVPPQGDC